MAIKLEGGGGNALMAWPLVEELYFCGFPKQTDINQYINANILYREALLIANT